MKVLLGEEQSLGGWGRAGGEGGRKIGKMKKVVLEAQGEVVLGELKTLEDSESQVDPAYPDEVGSWE